MTCRICGHHQNGGCCEKCHEVHRRLEEDYLAELNAEEDDR